MVFTRISTDTNRPRRETSLDLVPCRILLDVA
jgi:hypothetical protein